MKLLLSFSLADQGWAREFAELLRDAGFEVLRGKSGVLRRNETLDDFVRHTLKSADILVPILSMSSVRNPNGLFELGVALGLRKSVVCVVIHRAGERPVIPTDLAGQLVIQAETPKQATEQLIRYAASVNAVNSAEPAGSLSSVRRAVDTYEQQAMDNFPAYAPALASSLNNLSNRLAESGDRAGGLAAIRRAVEIREQLARENFAAYAPDLATSLNNLSNQLADSGDRAGGLAAIRRAVEIREQLARENFAAYASDLATSLNNLSNQLADSGDRAGGLAAIRRAVEIRESLTQGNFAAYAPDLAEPTATGDRSPSNTRRRFKSSILLAGAVAILMALASLYAGRDLGRVSTAAGERRHITLADGSVTHVGARTQLKVEFSDDRRIVHLYRGEAVFDVAKDSTRPFTVITPLIDVTAVGTRFGISIDSEVTATVLEGVVRVTARDDLNNRKEVMLQAGQQLRISDNALSETKLASVDPRKALGWAHSWLEFQDETIGEAALEFNRYNVVQIEIEDPAIAQRVLRGYYRFPVDSPVSFARAVAALHGIAVIEDRSRQVIRLELEERQ